MSIGDDFYFFGYEVQDRPYAGDDDEQLYQSLPRFDCFMKFHAHQIAAHQLHPLVVGSSALIEYGEVLTQSRGRPDPFQGLPETLPALADLLDVLGETADACLVRGIAADLEAAPQDDVQAYFEARKLKRDLGDPAISTIHRIVWRPRERSTIGDRWYGDVVPRAAKYLAGHPDLKMLVEGDIRSIVAREILNPGERLRRGGLYFDRTLAIFEMHQRFGEQATGGGRTTNQWDGQQKLIVVEQEMSGGPIRIHWLPERMDIERRESGDVLFTLHKADYTFSADRRIQ